MPKHSPAQLSRRGFIQTLLAGPIAYLLSACGIQPAPTTTPAIAPTRPVAGATPTPPPPAQAPIRATESAATAAPQTLAPTPACGDADDPTPPQTAGPFYTPDTPLRTSFIENNLSGSTLTLTGYVLDTNCQPIANALLDFWHCDSAGNYDNVGYKLRGHQFTTDVGQFTLETILPGLYPGRTRHIHVRLQAPNQPILTTQLYFPNEPDNAADGIYDPALAMAVQDAAGGKTATFNFVLSLS